VTLNTYFISQKSAPLLRIMRWSRHTALSTINELQLLENFRISEKLPTNLPPAFMSRWVQRRVNQTRFVGLSCPSDVDLEVRHEFDYFHLNSPIDTNLVHQARQTISTVQTRTLGEAHHQVDPSSNSLVTVHIRGGDYLKDSTFRSDVGYYRNALKNSQDAK